MESFGNISSEVQAAANELGKNMAENMKASINMCVAATDLQPLSTALSQSVLWEEII